MIEQSSIGVSTTYSSEYTQFGLVMGNGYQRSDTDFETAAFAVILGNSCIFEGYVGDIEDSDTWTNLNYSFGLFTYNVNRTNGVSYRVVNYWVGGAQIFMPSVLKNITANDVPFSIWIGTIILPILYLISYIRRKSKKYFFLLSFF